MKLTHRLFIVGVLLCFAWFLQPQYANSAKVILLAGGGGGGSAFSSTFVSHGEDTAGGTTVTYNCGSSCAFGATDTNRLMVVVVCDRNTVTNSTGNSVTALTVGGTSASQVASAAGQSSAGFQMSDIWQATGVAGTSGNIVVTWANSSTRGSVGVYRVITATTARTSANGTAGTSGNSLNTSITVPSGGAGISVYGNRAPGNANNITWTNATSDYNADQIGANTTCGSATSSSAGATTVTASISGSASTDVAMSSATWGP